MGVNVLQNRRRMMAAVGPHTLPTKYQQVAYLSRTNTAVGPYSEVNIPVINGDKITFRVKVVNQSGEQAFAGNPNTSSQVEFYYQNNSGNITCYPSARVTRSNESGLSGTDEPDLLIVTAVQDFTLLNFGVYRTTNYYFNGKIYGMIIQDINGRTKHEFVPCYRKADEVPGFYDIITQTFYVNEATSGAWALPV